MNQFRPVSVPTFAIALAALAFGCTAQTLEDEYRSAVPRSDALTVDVPDHAGESTEGAAAAPLIGERAIMYQATRDASRTINGTVWVALSIIRTIVEHPPTVVDETHAMWGPWNESLSPISYRLVVERLEDDGEYRYVLQAKPRDGGEDAWENIAAGESVLGAAGRLRSGKIALDFDQAHALDAEEHKLQGRFVSRFDLTGDAHQLEAAFEDIINERGEGPTSALYRYTRRHDGSGQFEFAARTDLDDEGDAPEDLLVLSRWDSSGAGRGDAIASKGDLGDAVVRVSECWDTSFDSSYWNDNADLQPNDGDPDSCAFAEPDWSEMGE